MSTTVASGPATQMTTGQMIEKYIALRDKKQEIEDTHKRQLKPYTEALSMLENLLLDQLNTEGIDSLKGGSGTAYRTTHISITVNRWSETLEFIRKNDAWELLEARVSKTAAQAFMEETKSPVPGTVVSQVVKVNVRRS